MCTCSMVSVHTRASHPCSVGRISDSQLQYTTHRLEFYKFYSLTEMDTSNTAPPADPEANRSHGLMAVHKPTFSIHSYNTRFQETTQHPHSWNWFILYYWQAKCCLSTIAFDAISTTQSRCASAIRNAMWCHRTIPWSKANLTSLPSPLPSLSPLPSPLPLPPSSNTNWCYTSPSFCTSYPYLVACRHMPGCGIPGDTPHSPLPATPRHAAKCAAERIDLNERWSASKRLYSSSTQKAKHFRISSTKFVVVGQNVKFSCNFE